MKYAIILTFLLVTFSSSAEQLEVDRIFTDAGYPYKNLIMKAERVELIYSEEQNKTTCRVQVYDKGQLHQSEQLEVSSYSFSKQPVTSCLERKRARHILSLL
ncbi:hypothetical protein [Pseudoalteromonas luteoviolacea]|uniref:Uncharacterized protein n=1 Tax=Pseudoalteromonas luteoviolacea H33 TaxID=1365251 RepID=A0A167FSS1_9GAMM|nr:hypothetical protein [Pseudoalteromonas luteoviolacea]KZN52936.1 hypothetical protein N476_09130 [Pseudoalteromonas luteoviolacea H33]KZN78147.1 hypothetical protein N477_10935 [Pseudoalteromonas luteoviolacea H33-S]